MSVKPHPRTNPTCYQVRRKINGESVQYYFPFTLGKRKAKKLADEKDKELAVEQEKYAVNRDPLFHPDGKIVGLERTLRQREGRSDSDQFKIRARQPNGKHIYSSRSIDANGFDKAFNEAVALICEAKKIEVTPALKRKLNKAKKHYK